MKKFGVIGIVCLLFCVASYANGLYCSVGYEPNFIQLSTNNKEVRSHIIANEVFFNSTYKINESFGINARFSTSIFPTITINEYQLYTKPLTNESYYKKIKTNTVQDFTNSFSSFQLGFSSFGDLGFGFFSLALNFDTVLLHIENQTSIFNGVCLDYSYSQKIKDNVFLSLGWNSGITFISYSPIILGDYNTNLLPFIYKVAPYISVIILIY